MELKSRYQDFEQTLRSLLKEARVKKISVHKFLGVLSGRGKLLLLIALSLGFAQVPGIAIVLGIFIAYLGIRVAAGKSFVWIPKFLRHKKIPSYVLIKVIKYILQILRFLKRWSYPRYEHIASRVISGLAIALVGLCLAASPPVPLTSLIASVAILLISIGLLNGDGVYSLLGYAASLFYLMTVLVLLKYLSFTQVVEWIKGFG